MKISEKLKYVLFNIVLFIAGVGLSLMIQLTIYKGFIEKKKTVGEPKTEQKSKPVFDKHTEELIKITENKRLPLLIQNGKSKVNNLTNIEILDSSLVIVNSAEPYTGYFTTVWTYNNKVKDTVFVEITNIQFTSDTTFSYTCRWEEAFISKL